MDPGKVVQLYQVIRSVRALPPDLLSRLFAYLIAPAIVAGLSWIAIGRPGTLFSPEYALSVTELASYADTGAPLPHAGVALVVEATRDEYALPVATERPRRLITSLTPQEWDRNRERLGWNGSDLRLKFPLLGVSRPIVVLAEGKAGEDLFIGGGKIPIARLQVVARRSVNLVTWAFVSAIFGIGIGVASEDAPSKHARREDGAEEDEDEIIERNPT